MYSILDFWGLKVLASFKSHTSNPKETLYVNEHKTRKTLKNAQKRFGCFSVSFVSFSLASLATHIYTRCWPSALFAFSLRYIQFHAFTSSLLSSFVSTQRLSHLITYTLKCTCMRATPLHICIYTKHGQKISLENQPNN